MHIRPDAFILALTTAALLGSGAARADDRHGDHGRHDAHRHYPSRGVVVSRLPRDAHPIHHRHDSYYVSGGIWYRPLGSRYMVVTPPLGAFITVLPRGYVTLEFGGRPYYRYDDIYYARRDNGYIVVAPPVDAGEIAPAADPAQNELFIYPKMDQSASQQASDRYECHEWASDQTGYDPTRASGGVPPAQSASRRDGYQRAMSACLEARGYTVR
ncbi:MAG: hypothetical protein KKD25_19275 [Gammaproteobacteria bacterium]|jgi:hypothetical protein|nr:hypothetical protein [Gammaproteobacteria bacterium]MBU0773004.1 hypothetical protein [Gammaproteobacteria bacterium]MBU0856502.1 hypothetical protein [Gammaproteobacteria bacterium]MBU1847718.1 hypothetical protein [Gammaproteobacteria bacterium]